MNVSEFYHSVKNALASLEQSTSRLKDVDGVLLGQFDHGSSRILLSDEATLDAIKKICAHLGRC